MKTAAFYSFMHCLLSGFLLACPALASDGALVVTAPDVMREGQECTFQIETSLPDAVSASLVVSGERLPVGGKSRGSFHFALAGPTPLEASLQPENPTRSLVISVVPDYYDTTSVLVSIKIFNASGDVALRHDLSLGYLPAFVPADFTEGVVVSKDRQRMFCLKEGRVQAAFVVSTGRRHPDGGGPTPSMDSRIINKARSAWSRKYEVTMPYWNAITPDGRYGIHATSPNLYPRLGTPDSHGCIRLHRQDARDFFEMFPVGARVLIL